MPQKFQIVYFLFFLPQFLPSFFAHYLFVSSLVCSLFSLSSSSLEVRVGDDGDAG